MNTAKIFRVPALFWFDYLERAPVDSEGQMAEQLAVHGKVVSIIANEEQLTYLRNDAQFYADGNVDDCARIVKSAKATLKALQ
jgi:hypothetical protein